MNSDGRPKVLFLCTGNACRSQMAEAWTRHRFGDRIEAASAGTNPAGLDPLAATVLAEAGVSTEGAHSKKLEPEMLAGLDLLVTVCDAANEACPVVPPGVRHLHHGFPDPPALAREMDDEAGRPRVYRDVRDQVRGWVEGLPRRLGIEPPLG